MDIYHRQLLDPGAYPDSTTSVAFRETHISRVYLTDTRAYKLKKPLNLGFLDFSTLERRSFYCAEEVRLNRRFAPDIYLGVISLNEEAGSVRFDGPGRTVDYAVCMKRLPQERMLEELVECSDPSLPGRMPELAGTLHRLFLRAEPCCAEQVPNVKVVKDNCQENLEQTEAAVGAELTGDAHRLMQGITARGLERLERLFILREKTGFVRNGHGDLHTGNICMTDPIQVYDCIEFNRRFRVADLAADLAFLLMDLEFRNRRDLSDRLLTSYQEHAQDSALPDLLPFYKQYRAWVRGKVDAMLAAEAEASLSARRTASEMARRYFNLALGYSVQPMLMLVTGLMGVGKTSLARAVSRATGATVIRSDEVRKELAGLPAEAMRSDAYGEGLYTAAMTDRTYGELYDRCASHLARSESVILDASFGQPDLRHRFLGLADTYGVTGCLVHVQCPDAIALARLDRRTSDASDGRRELYHDQKQTYVPPVSEDRLLLVDNTQRLDYNVQLTLCHLIASQEQP